MPVIDFVYGIYWKNFRKSLDHIHSTMPLKVPYKIVCIILIHMTSFIHVGRVCLRVIIWRRMHGCVIYTVNKLSGYRHTWMVYFGLSWLPHNVVRVWMHFFMIMCTRPPHWRNLWINTITHCVGKLRLRMLRISIPSIPQFHVQAGGPLRSNFKKFTPMQSSKKFRKRFQRLCIVVPLF